MTGEIVDLGTGCSLDNRYFGTSGDVTIGAAWHLHAAWAVGSVVTVSWTNIASTGPVGAGHTFIQLKDDQGRTLWQEFHNPGSGPGSRTVTLGSATQLLEFGIGSGNNGNNISIAWVGVSMTSTLCGGACPYGVRPKAGIPETIVLTGDSIDPWLAALAARWLAPIFSPLYQSYLLTKDLCSRPPPPLPAIDLSTLHATAETLKAILSVVAWPSLCECSPGSPAPTPPAAPVLVEPIGWPSPPTFTCDNANICATLESILAQLAQMQQTLGSTYQLSTLMQRYNLPFGTIPGATHGPLTGKGQFPVDRLIGLRVAVVSTDGSHPIIQDVPPYLWDLGWMSVFDEQGLLHERRVNRGSFDWLPDEMPLALQVGYSLTAGTSITIQELEAEP